MTGARKWDREMEGTTELRMQTNGITKKTSYVRFYLFIGDRYVYNMYIIR